MYWRIDEASLGEEVLVEAIISPSGDECHRNLSGLSKKRRSKICRIHCKPPNLRICLGIDDEEFSEERLLGHWQFQ